MAMFRKSLSLLVSLPKSAILNLRLFPLKTALRLPVLCANSVRLSGMRKGAVTLSAPARFAMVRLGMTGSPGDNENLFAKLTVQRGGRLTLGDDVVIGKGFNLFVGKNAVMSIGNHFACNINAKLSAVQQVSFDRDVLVGGNVDVRDSDGHTVFGEDGIAKENRRPVSIGQHVWLASKVSVLKGVTIPAGCMVAYGSCCTKAFDAENALIAGFPAKVIQENIRWEE